MRFAEPMILWTLAAVPPVAALLVIAILRRRRAMEKIAGSALLSRLVVSTRTETKILKAALACLGCALLGVALARPQWGSSLDPVSRKGVDVVIAIDVSLSMLAEDVRPSRLAKATSEASHFLESLHGDRVAIVAFAGSAATLCPLTLDSAAARLFLDAIDPGILSDPGTDVGTALQQIASTFKREDRRYKAAVIFSDGEDLEGNVESALAEAADQGVVIHTVGVGTPTGGPIPMRDANGVAAGYKTDGEGRVVTTRLQEETLAAISEKSGGLYLPATPGEGEITRIAEAVGSMDKREMQQRLLTRYEERFQVPLALAIIFLVLDLLIPDRKKARARAAAAKAAVVLLIVALTGAGAASAASASSLVEEGNRLFKEGKFDEALNAYTQAQIQQPDSPEIQLNIGNVFYRKGEIEKAREAYSRAFSARQKNLSGSARFNAGTADLNANDLKQAVENYREALKIDPDDADARHNLELALMRLRQQQQQQQSSPQNKQDQKKDDQSAEKNQSPSANDPNNRQNPSENDQARAGQDQKESPGQQDPQARKKERQEAERILDAIKGEDKPKIDLKNQRRSRRRSGKDW